MIVGVIGHDWIERLEEGGVAYLERVDGRRGGPRRRVGVDDQATRIALAEDHGWFLTDELRTRFARAAEVRDRLGLNCAACGACCCSVFEKIWMLVNLNAIEAAELNRKHPGAAARTGCPMTGLSAFAMVDVLDDHGSRCQFFRGNPGGPCSCGIYNDRPQPCWVFPVGIEECLRIRRHVFDAYGLPRSVEEQEIAAGDGRAAETQEGPDGTRTDGEAGTGRGEARGVAAAP